MFGLTHVTALSLLALRVLAQESSAAPASAVDAASSQVMSAMPGTQSATPSASGAAPSGSAPAGDVAEDGSEGDGNDVPPAAGGNPGWNTTYFMAPSNSKAFGFWVNGIENKAYWKPVNITSRLVLTNSNKELYGGEMELANNIAGGVGEWKGMLTETLPDGHNYLLALYDGTSGSKLGQTSGFTMRANGTLPPQAPPGVAGGATENGQGQNTQEGGDAQTSGGNAPSGQQPSNAQTSGGAAAPSGSAAPSGAAGRLAVSGGAVALAAAAYILA